MKPIDISKIIHDFIVDKDYFWDGSQLIIREIAIFDESKKAIIELENITDQFELFVNGKRATSRDLHDGIICEIRLSPPQNQKSFFAKDLNQFLKRDFALHPGVDSLIITDSSYVSWQHPNNQTNEIKAYFALKNLLQLFICEEIAMKTNANQIAIVFANKSSTFEINLDEQVLSQYYSNIIVGTDRIISIFNDSIHKEEKKRLLKSEILRLTQSSPQDSRFVHLCMLLGDVADNFSNNYDIFISGFSFQSEKEKINDELTTFSKKINEITSTIQTQILAIPLTLILSYSQMKTDPNDNPLLVNSLVVVASIIFSLLVWYLLSSRKLTLSLLETEINSKAQRYQIELPGPYLYLEKEFSIVKNQVKNTNNMLLIIKILLVAGAISTIVMFFLLTPQFQETNSGNFGQPLIRIINVVPIHILH